MDACPVLEIERLTLGIIGPLTGIFIGGLTGTRVNMLTELCIVEMPIVVIPLEAGALVSQFMGMRSRTLFVTCLSIGLCFDMMVEIFVDVLLLMINDFVLDADFAVGSMMLACV